MLHALWTAARLSMAPGLYLQTCQGQTYLAPRVVQIVVGLLNILLVFLLGRRLSGNTAGIVAAFLMSVSWAGSI